MFIPLLNHGVLRTGVTLITAILRNRRPERLKKRARRPVNLLILNEIIKFFVISFSSFCRREFRVGFEATFTDIDTFIFLFLGDADAKYFLQDQPNDETGPENPSEYAANTQ